MVGYFNKNITKNIIWNNMIFETIMHNKTKNIPRKLSQQNDLKQMSS